MRCVVRPAIHARPISLLSAAYAVCYRIARKCSTADARHSTGIRDCCTAPHGGGKLTSQVGLFSGLLVVLQATYDTAMGRNPFYGKASACTGDVSNYPFKSVHDTVAMPPIGVHTNYGYGGDSVVLRIKIKFQGAYTMDLFGGQPACACVGVCAKLWLYTGKPDVAPTAILPKGLDIKTVIILPNTFSNTVHHLGTLRVGDYVYVVLDHVGDFGSHEDVAYVRWRLKKLFPTKTTEAAATTTMKKDCYQTHGRGAKCIHPDMYTCSVPSEDGLCSSFGTGTVCCSTGVAKKKYVYAATLPGFMCREEAKIDRYATIRGLCTSAHLPIPCSLFVLLLLLCVAMHAGTWTAAVVWC